MIELKFRVFDGKQFSYFVIGQPFGGWALSVYDDHCINGREFQQYTGLKDKNNKEIYRGDIIRILYTDWASQTPDENGNYAMTLEEYKISKSAIGFVDWDYYSTGWIIRTKSKYSVDEDGTVMTSIIHGQHGEREVIGNIFETPELLNQ